MATLAKLAVAVVLEVYFALNHRTASSHSIRVACVPQRVARAVFKPSTHPRVAVFMQWAQSAIWFFSNALNACFLLLTDPSYRVPKPQPVPPHSRSCVDIGVQSDAATL